MWHVYGPDGKLRGTFEEKADASLFLLRSTTQSRSEDHHRHMRETEAETRSEGHFPLAYGTLLMTGNPFVWHFATIVVVFLFVVGVGVPIVSNLFNAVFDTGRTGRSIEVAQVFSGVSFLYLAVLTLGAILLAILRATGMQGGFARRLLVGGLFNVSSFGMLLIGLLGGAAIILGVLGLFGFQFWRAVTYYGLVILAIYSLTNYFYRELLS
ncbi:MAG: hypothetical protein AAFV33_27380 [Chloroflexota bacterium]